MHHVLSLLMRLMRLVRSRDSKYGGGNEEREQTLNQLLSEMDGFDGQEGYYRSGSNEQTGNTG